MGFPNKVIEDLLIDCNRSCCICHKFCGPRIEVHHIIPENEGGSNKEDNGIPLCFDCHAEVRAYDDKHPKGKKYTSGELRRHKKTWINKCSSLLSTRDLAENYKKADKRVFSQLYKLVPFEFVDYLVECLATKDWLYLRDIEDIYKALDFMARPDKEFFSIELIPALKKFFKSLADIDSFFGKHHSLEVQNGREILFPDWKRSKDQINMRDEYDEKLRELAKSLEESYYSFIRTFRALFPEFSIPDNREMIFHEETLTFRTVFPGFQRCEDQDIKVQIDTFCNACRIPLKEKYGAAGAYGRIEKYECPSCGLSVDPEHLEKTKSRIKSKVIKEHFSS